LRKVSSATLRTSTGRLFRRLKPQHHAIRIRCSSPSALLAPFSTTSFGKNTVKHEAKNKRLQSTQIIKDDTHSPDLDPPFTKILAANRGEIATRILRACSELGVVSAGIYSHEDRFTQHRYKADQAFLLSMNKVSWCKCIYNHGTTTQLRTTILLPSLF